MAKQVNLYEAKTQLSQLVDAAAAGEEIVIAKNGKPLAVLKSFREGAPGKRAFGLWKGEARAPSPEEWAEMDREVLELFEDSLGRPDPS